MIVEICSPDFVIISPRYAGVRRVAVMHGEFGCELFEFDSSPGRLTAGVMTDRRTIDVAIQRHTNCARRAAGKEAL